jgi:EAL domain-containing protein (putative c-di-GMP-specific phosphodiesterase class I)
MPIEVFLECAVGGGARPKRYDIAAFPATIGRHADCGVCLPAGRISRRHAQILVDAEGGYRLRDLGSTNGTFLNGRRIDSDTTVLPGDVIHVGDQELRLAVAEIDDLSMTDAHTVIGLATLPHEFPVAVREFHEMVERELVAGYRQPIVDARGRLFGFELLGRGNHPGLDAGPGQLFALAEALERAADFSEILRRRAFAEADTIGMRETLFFNIHPQEWRNPGRLFDNLAGLRECHPSLDLVCEVHEAAVTDLEAMASFRDRLTSLDIRLAYDDFGAGQARLQELVHVRPDFLKFDIALVRGVGRRDSPAYGMLARLNEMIRELGVHTLAEGIEDEATAEGCRAIGIDLLQGFFFGRPEPIGGPDASSAG